MIKKILIIFFIILLDGCSLSYSGPNAFGANEFVLDSYRIRQGKFSILQMQKGEELELTNNLLDEYEDTIDEGDILDITIFHPVRNDLIAAIKELNNALGFRVEKGKIYIPDFGEIIVGNLSLRDARKKVEAIFRREIKGIDLFLGYKERKIKKVELLGLVNISSIPVDGKIRLFEVLANARIPPDANLFKSYLIRNGQMLNVDLYKLVKEGDMNQNIVMRGGDKIYIAEPSAARLMVMGEVAKDCVVNLPAGFMSLREALAHAGGIPYTGDRSCIQVIRGSIINPKIYTLNWQHVLGLPNDSLLLIPGDIVYVASKPITEWNRFVSQILPTFGAFDIMTKGVKDVGIIVQ